MILASREDFEEPGGLYWPPYHRYDFFAVRADRIVDIAGPSVLVAGCGWGFLVDELRQRGAAAWGVDASAYAIERGEQEGIEGLYLADCRSRQELRRVLADVGVERFDLVVTEDLLPCLDDREAHRALIVLRGISDRQVHIVTSGGGGNPDSRMNWKSLEKWAEITGGEVWRA